MQPAGLDVYLVAAQWEKSEDRRPAVIIRAHADDRVACALVSSAFDLFRSGTDFVIESSRPEFPATGLKRRSFVTSRIVPILSRNRLIRRLGRLEGQLRTEFGAWWSYRTGRSPDD